jgi:hypothetical protein
LKLLTATLIAGHLVIAAGCTKTGAPAAQVAQAGPARVAATLQLPGGDGRVYIIAIPNEMLEVTRCIVAVSSTGAISSTCAPKELDLAPAPDQ